MYWAVKINLVYYFLIFELLRLETQIADTDSTRLLSVITYSAFGWFDLHKHNNSFRRLWSLVALSLVEYDRI